MSCCGKARTLVIRQDDIERGLAFELEYAGGRTMTVVGSVTGRRYTFSGMSRLQQVDPRDAVALLRERVFRLNRVIQPVAGS
jgi:hypothetical protein